MKSIKFLGAVGEVTGSGYILKLSSGKDLLIDLGMFQGTEETAAQNRIKPEIDIANLEAVLLTHAHLDHCGRLPMLAGMGYRGPIYMTSASRDLTELTLLDSAKIQEKDQEYPLYTTKDASEIIDQFQKVKYGQPLDLPSATATFRDAGHIIGSASIEIVDKISNKKIVFSGDLGNTPQNIERPTELIGSSDYVVIETTYGDKEHGKEDSVGILASEINEVERSGGALLIPSFSIERTQVLLHLVNHLKGTGKVKKETAVYLDSPMGLEATKIYKRYRDLYNQTLQDHSAKEDPFGFPGLVKVRTGRESEKLRSQKGPKVIIAGSGMMTGGRILGHAIAFLPKDTTRLLIVGYQAVETIGRAILEGAKTVQIYDEMVNVRATVTDVSGLSAHADQPKLLHWLGNIKGVEKLFLVHGEDNQRSVFKSLAESKLGIKEVFTPALNEELPLDVHY